MLRAKYSSSATASRQDAIVAEVRKKEKLEHLTRLLPLSEHRRFQRLERLEKYVCGWERETLTYIIYL